MNVNAPGQARDQQRWTGKGYGTNTDTPGRRQGAWMEQKRREQKGNLRGIRGRTPGMVAREAWRLQLTAWCSVRRGRSHSRSLHSRPDTPRDRREESLQKSCEVKGPFLLNYALSDCHDVTFWYGCRGVTCQCGHHYVTEQNGHREVTCQYDRHDALANTAAMKSLADSVVVTSHGTHHDVTCYYGHRDVTLKWGP